MNGKMKSIARGVTFFLAYVFLLALGFIFASLGWAVRYFDRLPSSQQEREFIENRLKMGGIEIEENGYLKRVRKIKRATFRGVETSDLDVDQYFCDLDAEIVEFIDVQISREALVNFLNKTSVKKFSFQKDGVLVLSSDSVQKERRKIVEEAARLPQALFVEKGAATSDASPQDAPFPERSKDD